MSSLLASARRQSAGTEQSVSSRGSEQLAVGEGRGPERWGAADQSPDELTDLESGFAFAAGVPAGLAAPSDFDRSDFDRSDFDRSDFDRSDFDRSDFDPSDDLEPSEPEDFASDESEPAETDSRSVRAAAPVR
jgi:hypothetical protein